jgi:hypothetical protein
MLLLACVWTSEAEMFFKLPILFFYLAFEVLKQSTLDDHQDTFPLPDATCWSQTLKRVVLDVKGRHLVQPCVIPTREVFCRSGALGRWKVRHLSESHYT